MARVRIREAHGGATREIDDRALPYFQGWVIIDTLDDSTDASPLYLSKAESDFRYTKKGDGGTVDAATLAASPELRAAFVAVVPPSGDTTGATDTAALNAALAAGGTVRGKAGGVYYLTKRSGGSSCLVIGTGTRLDMTGCTLNRVAGANCPMLTDSGHEAMLGGGTWTAPSNFGVNGGVWNGGTNAGTGNRLHMMILGGSSFAATDLTFSSTSGKYALLLQNGFDFTVRNIFANGTYSDGVHVQGPCARFVVENVHGTSGDDLFAITGADYASYVWGNESDVTDFSVTGVFPASGGSRAVILIPGQKGDGSDIRLDRGSVRNIKGSLASSTQPGIIIGNDTAAPGTTNGVVGHVLVEDVAITMPNPTGRYLVSIRTQKLAQVVTIARVHIVSDYAALVVVSDAGTGTGLVDKLVVRDVSGNPTATPAQIVSMNSGASAGTINHLIIDGVTVTNPAVGGSLVRSGTAGGQTLGRVVASNCLCANFSWIADLATSTSLNLAAVSMPAVAGVVSVRATGSVILSGGADTTATGTASVTAGGALRVRSAGISIDLSKVTTRVAGDMATNTNAALSCGAGPAVTDGTSWKNLFSGATY